MKIQDGIFFASFILILFLKKQSWFLFAGLFSFILAIPCFATWTFFTAERLTWYGSAFILGYLIMQIFFKKNLYKKIRNA